MESIYLRENFAWASETSINLNEYFIECQNVFNEIMEETKDVAISMGLKSEEEIESYLEHKKDSLRSGDTKKFYDIPDCMILDSLTSDVAYYQRELVKSNKIVFESEVLKIFMKRKNLKLYHSRVRRTFGSYFKFIKMLNVDLTECMLTRNHEILDKDEPHEILLEVQIFNTVPLNAPSKYGKPCQSFIVLGRQKLSELNDLVFCINNHIDIAGDCSDNIDAPVTVCLKDSVKSSMFFLGNTFYINGDEDYSVNPRRWGKIKGIHFNQEPIQMNEARFRDLDIRLNYPYLFQHLGNCQHTVMFNEVRFMTAEDYIDISKYPMCTFVMKSTLLRCSICTALPSVIFVVDSGRHIETEGHYSCMKCVKNYHYIGGKKVGSFKAYRYHINPLFPSKP